VFSVVRAVLLRNGAVDISAAVYQRASIEKAAFSAGAIPRLYNKDLTHLELELSGVPELAE
jgi:hypothetical protein